MASSGPRAMAKKPSGCVTIYSAATSEVRADTNLESEAVSNLTVRAGVAVGAMLALLSAGAHSEESPLRGGTIAYAVTNLRWATYLKPEMRVDCPQGVNDGPREQFKSLYPDD